VDFKHRQKLLLFFFDSRFTKQEGDTWHYLDESSPHMDVP
jgi:hypothetical protein